jgi:hypothetical protein
MKKKLFWVLLALLLILIQDSCELFGDSEHCQYEATDSKLWLPDRDPALGFVKNFEDYPFLEFGFARVDYLSGRSLKIENVCPFGAFKVVINLREKKPLYRIPWYDCNIFSVQNKIPILIKRIDLTGDVKDFSAWVGETTLPLIGITEGGPKTIYISVVAHFKKGDFLDDLGMESWAKTCIEKVTFTISYVKWE